MKQYTTPNQTAKLIELGFEEPKTIVDIFGEYKKWLDSHPFSYYIIFDERLTYWERPLNRFIVVKGIEISRFFGSVEIFTISGKEWLHDVIFCTSQKEASLRCRKLNAQYVHDNEPERFATSPIWQEDFALYCAK